MDAIEWEEHEKKSIARVSKLYVEVFAEFDGWNWEVCVMGIREYCLIDRLDPKPPLPSRDLAKSAALAAARELILPIADALGVGWKDGAEAMKRDAAKRLDKMWKSTAGESDPLGLLSDVVNAIEALPLPEVPREA